jgi:hypothetical protein
MAYIYYKIFIDCFTIGYTYSKALSTKYKSISDKEILLNL